MLLSTGAFSARAFLGDSRPEGQEACAGPVVQGLGLLPGWVAPSLGGRGDLGQLRRKGAFGRGGRLEAGKTRMEPRGPSCGFGWGHSAVLGAWGERQALEAGFWPSPTVRPTEWPGLALNCLALRAGVVPGAQHGPPASQAAVRTGQKGVWLCLGKGRVPGCDISHPQGEGQPSVETQPLRPCARPLPAARGTLALSHFLQKEMRLGEGGGSAAGKKGQGRLETLSHVDRAPVWSQEDRPTCHRRPTGHAPRVCSAMNGMSGSLAGLGPAHCGPGVRAAANPVSGEN